MPSQSTATKAEKSGNAVGVLNGNVVTSIKEWTDFARNVPSTLKDPAAFVNQYFGLAEKRLARRREIALKVVDALPKRSA